MNRLKYSRRPGRVLVIVKAHGAEQPDRPNIVFIVASEVDLDFVAANENPPSARLLLRRTGSGFKADRRPRRRDTDAGTLGLVPIVFGPVMNVIASTLANWWRAHPTDAVVVSAKALQQEGRDGVDGVPAYEEETVNQS